MAKSTPLYVGFVISNDDIPWHERAVGAALVGVGIYLAMYIATGVSYAWLDRESDLEQLEPEQVTKNPIFIAGMLVISLIWAWWQVDRDRVVRRIASCVHERARSDGLPVDRAAVLDCYQRGGVDDPRND